MRGNVPWRSLVRYHTNSPKCSSPNTAPGLVIATLTVVQQAKRSENIPKEDPTASKKNYSIPIMIAGISSNAYLKSTELSCNLRS